MHGMSFMTAPETASSHNAAPNILELLSYDIAFLSGFMVQKEDKGSFYGISPANCM
jgi:hypothetical protein